MTQQTEKQLIQKIDPVEMGEREGEGEESDCITTGFLSMHTF